MRKRIVSMMLTVAMVFSLFVATPPVEVQAATANPTVDVSTATGTIQIKDDAGTLKYSVDGGTNFIDYTGTLTLMGSQTTYGIEVLSGDHEMIFDDLTVGDGALDVAFDIKAGITKITLKENTESTLTSKVGAGLQVEYGAQVKITAEDSDGNTSNDGKLTAFSNGDAGIGSPSTASGGATAAKIDIYGNARVYGYAHTNGTGNGAGIGSGQEGSATVTISGNAVVTGYSSKSSYSFGAGIGSGYSGDATVDISGNAMVTGISSTHYYSYGAGIGSGQEGNTTVTISGNATVTGIALPTDGTSYSAAIGSGRNGISTINITGGTVLAQGGKDPGIGKGSLGNNTSVTITIDDAANIVSSSLYKNAIVDSFTASSGGTKANVIMIERAGILLTDIIEIRDEQGDPLNPEIKHTVSDIVVETASNADGVSLAFSVPRADENYTVFVGDTLQEDTTEAGKYLLYMPAAGGLLSVTLKDSAVSLVPVEVATWTELTNAMANGGNIVLTDNITAGDSDAALEVPSGKTVTIDLAGYKIDRAIENTPKENGNVITVNGNLTIKDTSQAESGTITGGYTIATNHSGYYACSGIHVASTGTLNLEGGKVTGNESVATSTVVPGILVEGTFTMTGGEISGNTGTVGTGVYVGTNGSFTMTGGSIMNNKTAAMSKGAVFISDDCTQFILGGTAVIKDNTHQFMEEVPSNVVVSGKGNSYITLSDTSPLQDTGSKIGISVANSSPPISEAAFAKGTNVANYLSYFVADDANSYELVTKSGDAENLWIREFPKVTFVLNNGPNTAAVMIKSIIADETKIPTPVFPGYSFKGWYDASGTKYEVSNFKALTDSITLTAKWEAPDGSSVNTIGNLAIIGGTEGTYEPDYSNPANPILNILTEAPLTIKNINTGQAASVSISIGDGVTANLTFDGIELIAQSGIDVKGTANITLAAGSINRVSSNTNAVVMGASGRLVLGGTGELSLSGTYNTPAISSGGEIIINDTLEFATDENAIPVDSASYTQGTGATGQYNSTDIHAKIKESSTEPPATDITAFTIDGQIGTSIINPTAHTVVVTLPQGTDVTALTPAVTISGVSVSPASGVATDFTNPVTYTVTATGGTTQAWTVTLEFVNLVDIAKTAAENATYGPIPQGESYDTADELMAYVQNIAETAINNSNITVGISMISFLKANAGTANDPDGTNGSYTFTIRVAYGSDAEVTTSKTVIITATPYTVPPTPPSGNGSSSNDDNDIVVKDPVTDDPNAESNTTIVVDPTTSGGVSKADIPERYMNEAVATALEKASADNTAPKVTIEVDTPSSAGGVEVQFDSAVLETLTENNEDASFAITSDVGTMTFDREALNAIAEAANGEEITLSIRKVEDESELTEEQRAIVGDAPIYELYIESNGVRISDFKGGSVRVEVPEELAMDDNSEVLVYYIDDEGNVEPVVATYNSADNTVSFETKHFSHYVIQVVDKSSSQTGVKLDKENHSAYMSGVGENQFAPDRSITRAEVVAIFSRLMVEKMDDEMTYTSNFTDITGDEWYANAIGYMEQFEIVSGYEDGTFRPNQPITRAEFATIASRFETFVESDTNNFSDVADDYWALPYINSVAAQGFVNGYPDGTFKPMQNITRAEAVTVVNNMLERTADEAFIADNMAELTTFVDVDSEHWAYYQILEASNGHEHAITEDKETWTELH